MCPLAHRYNSPVSSRSLRSRKRRSFQRLLRRYSHRRAAPLSISLTSLRPSSPTSRRLIRSLFSQRLHLFSQSLAHRRRARTREPAIAQPISIHDALAASLTAPQPLSPILCLPTPSPLRSWAHCALARPDPASRSISGGASVPHFHFFSGHRTPATSRPARLRTSCELVVAAPLQRLVCPFCGPVHVPVDLTAVVRSD